MILKPGDLSPSPARLTFIGEETDPFPRLETDQFPDGFQSCPASRQQERRAEVNATLLDFLTRLDDFTSSAS
ncbi:hypothetical protein AB0H94_44485 [Streptomyces purpurascens]|uniref:hypothetical protein n=1 Tax=Streptomyces purpurascens TaxID=1924 RepID=UPI0033FD4AA0